MDPVSFNDNNTEPEAPVGETTVSEPVGEEDLSLANPFLNKVAPQDRAIVARYIKEWDAGVTKKFQDYAGKLKPYEQLGPVDQVQKAWQLQQIMNTQPELVFRHMWNAMSEHYGENFDSELFRILQIQEQEQAMTDYQEQPGYEQDPTEVFQNNVTQELEDLRNWKEQQEQNKVEAEQNAQLDKLFQQAHNAYGDFDEDWVLIQLSKHGNLQKALQDWQKITGSNSQGPARQAPKVMGGQGGVPSGQIDASKLRGKDRRAAVEAMLAGLSE